MRISDLITVRGAPRAVDLAQLSQLLEALAREGADLTLGTAGQLGELLGEYVSADAEPVDALRALIAGIAADGEGGSAALVMGSAGSGKSHLLSLVALLANHPTAWSVFLQSHPAYADLRDRLKGRRYLVVPIPLCEHRGHEEHLEDIVFDRTERVLSSPAYGLAVPLSEQSYALDLIDRHIVPRYSDELDMFAREQSPGVRNWQAMRKRNPARAAEVARQFAAQMNYPLDFRQSRVERLSRLIDLVRDNSLNGIVWLIDDLTEFLSGAGTKAVHSDCAFLDFLGQRCKIAPLHVVAALNEGLEQLSSVEPYLVNAIRAGYRHDLVLSAAQMRAVARRRVLGRVDPEKYDAAIQQVREACRNAFGTVTFSCEELAGAYPLHPAALECLESIAARFFGAADTFVAFLQDLLGHTSLGGVLARDYRQIIGVDEVFDYLRPRIASHPEVSAYIYDVLDYYEKNAAEMLPEEPQLVVRLIRQLVIFRLANVAAPVPLLVECMGLDETGAPRAEAPRVLQALEAMRVGGSFVDARRGAADAPAVYQVDLQTSVSDLLRKRVAAAKASYGPGDARVWKHALSVCDEPAFPLTHLQKARTLEVEWQNTFRCISAELTDLGSLPSGAMAELAGDLADPATVEDICLLLTAPGSRDAQLAAWRSLAESAPASRWSAAILAWIPRELTAAELDELKEFAAIADLSQDERALAADTGMRDQLGEMYGPAAAQARKIVRKAYYEGQVISPYGEMVGPAALAPLAGDWAATLQQVTAPAFARVFPDFPAIAPRRPLVSREQVDSIVNRVIRPGKANLPPGDPLRELVDSCLAPLGLVSSRADEYTVDVSRSKIAAGVMARVRQRDNTPLHETGRPIACADLAQHLVKSASGLPPELFELVVAALIRTGYLAALQGPGQLIRMEDIPVPLSGSINYVARPPLLSHNQWQILARVCRIALDYNLPVADFPVQQHAWERLVAARVDYLDRAEALKARLLAHVEELEQRPSLWREALADIEALQNTFRCVRPELHPAPGLQEFIQDVEGFIGDSQGASRLMGLFRRIDTLAAYLDRLAPDVIQVRDYMLSPALVLPPNSDLEARRQAVLALIGSGEQILSEEMNLRRLVQIFLGSYKRIYASWHGRVYRSPIYDQYRAVNQSPEMRALQQLGKLNLNVATTAEDMERRIEEQAAGRCTRADLSEVLDTQPVCPDCRLALNEEPELVSVESLVAETRQAIEGYLQALAVPALRQRLREYAAAAPRRGDLGVRLEQIAQMPISANPRQILTYFTDDAITHVNRALAGKKLAPRNFGELRKSLEGRTVTREEAERLFNKWLQGDGAEIEDDGLLQIDE